MSQETRYYRVGLFVFVGIALLVAAPCCFSAAATRSSETVISRLRSRSPSKGLDVGLAVQDARRQDRQRSRRSCSPATCTACRTAIALPDEHTIDVVVRVEVTPTPNMRRMVNAGANDTVGGLDRARFSRASYRRRHHRGRLSGGRLLASGPYPSDFPPWAPDIFTSRPRRARSRRSRRPPSASRACRAGRRRGRADAAQYVAATMNDAAGKLDLENVQSGRSAS